MNIKQVPDHSWIDEVLSDIGDYAAKNNLRKLQEMVAQTRIVADNEITKNGSQENFNAVILALYPNSYVNTNIDHGF